MEWIVHSMRATQMQTRIGSDAQGVDDRAASRRLARAASKRLARLRKREAHRQGMFRELTVRRAADVARLQSLEEIRARFTRGMTNSQTIALDQVIEDLRETLRALDSLLLDWAPAASA